MNGWILSLMGVCLSCALLAGRSAVAAAAAMVAGAATELVMLAANIPAQDMVLAALIFAVAAEFAGRGKR